MKRKTTMIEDKKNEDGDILADASRYLKGIDKVCNINIEVVRWENISLDKCDIYMRSKGKWVLIHEAEL